MENDFLFQSTPPVKAATLCQGHSVQAPSISIHAAREGGDLSALEELYLLLVISIHAAREGGDAKDVTLVEYAGNFNPRRP